jgi:hypothetical protein
MEAQAYGLYRRMNASPRRRQGRALNLAIGKADAAAFAND